jgi:uncharacterized protein
MPKDDIKRRPAMEIAISSLSDGDHPFVFEVPAKEIGLDDSFLGNIKVEGTLRKVSKQIILDSTIHTTYQKECDRCLAEIGRAAEVPLELFYRTTVAGERAREEDGEDSDIRVINPDQDSIVLDEEVRQTTLLAIPLKMLCQEACKGLCAKCGADLNGEECRCEEPEIDPRWEKLADLLKKKDN